MAIFADIVGSLGRCTLSALSHILLVVACALILGACALTGEPRTPEETPTSCQLTDSLHVLGMPPDAEEFRIQPQDENYLEQRCQRFRAVARTYSSLDMTRQPVGIWQGHGQPLHIAVRLQLQGVPNRQPLPREVRDEIRRLGREALIEEQRPIVVLGSGKRAKHVVEQLAKVGVQRDRMYVNVSRNDTFQKTLRPEGGKDMDAVSVLEFATEPGFVSYVGGGQAVTEDDTDGADQEPTEDPPPEDKHGEQKDVEQPSSAPDSGPSPGDEPTEQDKTPHTPRSVIEVKSQQEAPKTFGGRVVQGARVDFVERIGWEPDTGWFSWGVGEAKADSAPDRLTHSCVAKRLAKTEYRDSLVRDTSAPTRAPSAYLPGLFGLPWVQMRNGHLVILSSVAVLRDDSIPASAPTLRIYWDYDGDTTATPDIKAVGAAGAIRGAKGVLYRAYFDEDAWPVRCMDLVFQQNGEINVSYGKLYYEDRGRLMVTDFIPGLYTGHSSS